LCLRKKSYVGDTVRIGLLAVMARMQWEKNSFIGVPTVGTAEKMHNFGRPNSGTGGKMNIWGRPNIGTR
jgi:hypothetical protein